MNVHHVWWEMRDAVHFDSTRNESFEKKKNRDGEGDGRQTIYLKSNSFEKFRRASFRTAVGRAASAAPQWKATELQADLCYARLVPRWKEPSPLCSENLFILIMTLNSNQSTSIFCKKKIKKYTRMYKMSLALRMFTSGVYFQQYVCWLDLTRHIVLLIR